MGMLKLKCEHYGFACLRSNCHPDAWVCYWTGKDSKVHKGFWVVDGYCYIGGHAGEPGVVLVHDPALPGGFNTPGAPECTYKCYVIPDDHPERLNINPQLVLEYHAMTDKVSKPRTGRKKAASAPDASLPFATYAAVTESKQDSFAVVQVEGQPANRKRLIRKPKSEPFHKGSPGFPFSFDVYRIEGQQGVWRDFGADEPGAKSPFAGIAVLAVDCLAKTTRWFVPLAPDDTEKFFDALSKRE